MRSHYDTFGVSRHATSDEIRQSYRRIAKERHPDTAGGSDAAMRLLNEAYATLKDPGSRASYDQFLALPAKARSRTPAPPPPALDPQTFQSRVFQPLDRDVKAALRDMAEALGEIEEAMDDEDVITAFDLTVESTGRVLTRALNLLASVTWPQALADRLTTYRDGLRQAEAAVDILGAYSLDLDASALDDGGTLLQQAIRQLAASR